LTEESGFNLLARSRACDAGAFGIGRESRRAGMRSSGINCRNAHYSLRPTLDEYDNEGNLIQKTSFSGDHTVYAWDHRNRLTSVTDYDDEETNLRGVNYSYDAFNQMVKRVEDRDGDTGSAAIDQAFYLYDQGQVALEFHKWGTGSATASHLSHRYLWNPAAVDQLLTDEQVVDLYNTEVNETLWALTDRLGSVTDMIDNFGGQRLHRSFDSFGNITYETHCDVEGLEVTVGWAGYLDEAFAYTGRFFDSATGLQNNLNRWYDASTGRWLSEDPIGFAAGDANLYRYVGNSPTNGTDPSGLQAAIGGGGFDPWQGTPWEQQPIGGDGPSEAQDFFTGCLRDIAKDWGKEQIKPQPPYSSTLGPSIGPEPGREPVFKCEFDIRPKKDGVYFNFEVTW
jgi:RHS repeat-associated protein